MYFSQVITGVPDYIVRCVFICPCVVLFLSYHTTSLYNNNNNNNNSNNNNFNPLSTELYLFDLKTQFVPRSKHSLLWF